MGACSSPMLSVPRLHALLTCAHMLMRSKFLQKCKCLPDMCLLWIKKHIVVTVGHRCPSEHVKVTCSAFFQTPVVTQDVPVLGVQPYVASSPAFIMPLPPESRPSTSAVAWAPAPLAPGGEGVRVDGKSVIR